MLKPDWITSVHLNRLMEFQPAKMGGADCLYNLRSMPYHQNLSPSSAKMISSLNQKKKRSLPARRENKPQQWISGTARCFSPSAIRRTLGSVRLVSASCLEFVPSDSEVVFKPRRGYRPKGSNPNPNISSALASSSNQSSCLSASLCQSWSRDSLDSGRNSTGL